MDNYEYLELDSQGREIRLMTLLPGKAGEEIHVTLRNVTLDPASPPSYEALSYAWGSAQDTLRIRVATEAIAKQAVHRSLDWSKSTLGSSDRDGFPRDSFHGVPYSSLDVTSNLAVALQHLRYEREPRVLWIDAICINQQDVHERSAQVERMGDIYRSARQTTIWLGPEEDDSCLAIEALDHLASKVTVDWSTYTVLAIGENRDDVDQDQDLPVDTEQLSSIERLLGRPWFERLWVWQEVRLARSAIVVCGLTFLQWDRFRCASFCLWYRGYLGDLSDKIIGILSCESSEEQASYTDLFSNLWKSRLCKCSDQRDRIYALVNVSSLPRSQSPAGQPVLRPDYSKDAGRVFQDFVLWEIEGSHSLRILLYCDLQEALPNVPSWVPNLPASIHQGSIHYFSAAGNTTAEAIHDGNGVLEVTGAFVSPIGEIIDVESPEEGWLDWQYDDFCGEIRRLAKLILGSAENNIYPTGLGLPEAFCRTIHLNSFADSVDNAAPAPALFQDAFDELSRILDQSGDKSTKSNVKRYLDNIELRSRKLFTTSDGYMGLAPLAARPGDQVSVLLGCQAPIVLRPADDGCFVVVGYCYIHGYGDGEAFFGPLPAEWSRVRRQNGFCFIERSTGISQFTDPRLGELPDGWRRISDSVEQFPEFFNSSTSEWTWDDPRQSAEAIRARGVDLRTILMK
ncbi:MAG: hypothetical protein LQ349_004256 [Xanthoria aureola]|nr:MAG: hypothetical protein LQ349_004256 [Xanthoria aureola]